MSNFLSPSLIATVFMARMALSTSYLCASYLCAQSKNTILLKLSNSIRTAMFCCDNLVLLGLLLNYGASTVSTLIHCADASSSWITTFGSFAFIGLMACCLVPFVVYKGKLSCLFSVNVSTFIFILFLWVYLLPSSFSLVCRYVSSFGVVGGFFIAQIVGSSLKNHSEPIVQWLLPIERVSKRCAFMDAWLGLPTESQLLRNYAVLNLIQLNFVNLILANQEQLSFVALSVTCLSAVPCLLLGLRHWNKMDALTVPTFGFVQILWQGNKSTLDLLIGQWKRNETPCAKASAFLGVFLCGLGFASPAHCASTELARLDSSSGEITPVDTGQGSPVAEGAHASNIRRSAGPYASDMGSKVWDYWRDTPSNLVKRGTDAVLAYVGYKGLDAITSGQSGGQESAEAPQTGSEQGGQEIMVAAQESGHGEPAPRRVVRHTDSSGHDQSSRISERGESSNTVEQPKKTSVLRQVYNYWKNSPCLGGTRKPHEANR